MRTHRKLYDKDPIEEFTEKKCGDRVSSGYAPLPPSILYFVFS